jgi:hypothetical protein
VIVVRRGQSALLLVVGLSVAANAQDDRPAPGAGAAYVFTN